MVVTSIHVANDLERVGDMAKTISRTHSADRRAQPRAEILQRRQAHVRPRSCASSRPRSMPMRRRNAAAAVEVCNADEEIDALYTSLFRELLTYMMEDPRNITQCTHLLFCSKSLERVGDHATNIAEHALLSRDRSPDRHCAPTSTVRRSKSKPDRRIRDGVTADVRHHPHRRGRSRSLQFCCAITSRPRASRRHRNVR